MKKISVSAKLVGALGVTVMLTSSLFAVENIYEVNGKFGIGTQQPRVKLEIVGNDSPYVGTWIVNTNTAAATLFTMGETATGGSTPFYIVRNGSTHQMPNLTSFYNAGSMVFSPGGRELLTMATQGLGIGTSTPTSILHVKGQGTSLADATYQQKIESTTTKVGLTLAHTGNGGALGYASMGPGALSNVFYITSGYGTIGRKGFVMDNEGRVGIGTATPNTSHLLTVAGGIYATNLVSSTNIQADYVLAKLGSHIGYNDLTQIPEGYAMAVRGKIYAEDFVTNTDVWADDVFEPQYELMPLSKLRSFVKTKKHLPGVPSEAEALSKNVSLSEMQVILLRKIEELTLYVLELETEIQHLKQDKLKQDKQSHKH